MTAPGQSTPARLAAALHILARVVEGDPRWTTQRPPTDARAALGLVARALRAPRARAACGTSDPTGAAAATRPTDAAAGPVTGGDPTP